MTEGQIFAEARQSFEVLPGVGSLEYAIDKLARAGIDRGRIRGWAIDVSQEYGIISYTRAAIDRAISGDAPASAQEAR
jgi:hypothetical protein